MIRSLQHAGITVPDVEVGRKYYEAFGLEPMVNGNDLIFRCAERAQDQIRLIQGARKKLSYVSFGTDRQGLAQIRTTLTRAGVELLPPILDIPAEGIWFRDPVGDVVNVQLAPDTPSRLPIPPDINSAGHVHRIGTRACDLASFRKRARPRRLGHLIKFSPDVNKSVEFYTSALGMKVSDRAGDIIAFLRLGCGGDHHVLGIAKSSHSGLHHLSFEVGDIDEMMIGAKTMTESGHPPCYGLGRHLPGSNYFFYFRDPWNSMVEYYWEMDFIPEDDHAWEPYDLQREVDLRAIWESAPAPQDFPLNLEDPN